MGAEKSWDKVDLMKEIQLFYCMQKLELCIKVQTVTGLGFGCCGPKMEHGFQSTFGFYYDLLQGSLPCPGNRGKDTAALLEYLHVGHALELPLQLVFPTPGKHQMGMWVNESRHNNPSLCIHLVLSLEIKIDAHCRDSTSCNSHVPTRDYSEVTHA